MIQVEANACGKPVIAINAMAFNDTMVHGETALLASVAQEIRTGEAELGEDHGFAEPHRVVFNQLRTSDYRASVHDIADHLLTLMGDPELRHRMGAAGRERVTRLFNYKTVATKFTALVADRLGIE